MLCSSPCFSGQNPFDLLHLSFFSGLLKPTYLRRRSEILHFRVIQRAILLSQAIHTCHTVH